MYNLLISGPNSGTMKKKPKFKVWLDDGKFNGEDIVNVRVYSSDGNINFLSSGNYTEVNGHSKSFIPTSGSSNFLFEYLPETIDEYGIGITNEQGWNNPEFIFYKITG